MTDDVADEPKILTLADGFCVRQEVDNIAWMDLGDRGLVVDALERPELEDEVFAAIRSTLGDKPVRHVLNTHTHYDHVALNDAFVRRCGAEIVNQDTRTIGPEGLWFEGLRRRVHMLPMPGCHTAQDCIVWVPEDRVLFVGDIFGWGLVPLIGRLRDDSARLLLDTYQRLIDFDAATVVAGHGPLLSSAELQRWVEYFHWLRREVSEACAAGRSDEQIVHDLAPPRDMTTWWRFVQWKHEDSVTKVIKAVRRGDLRGIG